MLLIRKRILMIFLLINIIINEETKKKTVKTKVNKPVVKKLSQEEINIKMKSINEKIDNYREELYKIKHEIKRSQKENKFNAGNITNNLIDIITQNFISYVKNTLVKKEIYYDFIIISYNGRLENPEILGKKQLIDNTIKECYEIFTEILLKLFKSNKNDKKFKKTIHRILTKSIKKFNINLLKEQFEYQQKVQVESELGQYIIKFCDFEDQFKNLECHRDIYNYIIRKLQRHIYYLDNISFNPFRIKQIKKIASKLKKFYLTKNIGVRDIKKNEKKEEEKVDKSISEKQKQEFALKQEIERLAKQKTN